MRHGWMGPYGGGDVDMQGGWRFGGRDGEMGWEIWRWGVEGDVEVGGWREGVEMWRYSVSIQQVWKLK